MAPEGTKNPISPNRPVVVLGIVLGCALVLGLGFWMLISTDALCLHGYIADDGRCAWE